jgi:dTMP kinase
VKEKHPHGKRFLVFEGIDGAGTTTQCRRLAARLQAEGLPVWHTSEPTTGPIGEIIRRVLAGEIAVSPETIAHLFAADRSDHLRSRGGIIDHLERGDYVVCDRYKYSSFAYQGVDVDIGLIEELNRRFADPGVVFFIDLPVSEGEARLMARATREIYERAEFQEQVRARYLDVLKRAGRTVRVVMLDGTASEESIAEKIWATLEGASIL